MSDEEEEFNDDEMEAVEDDGDAEGDEEESAGDEQEEAEADEDEEENSESSQEGSEAAETEDASNSGEESGDDAMEEDEPPSAAAKPKSPNVMKRSFSKSRESSVHSSRRSTSPASVRRQMLVVAPPQVRSYTIEPVCAIPHPSPTNAMAASFCMSHLLTGSDDGIIRDYDVFGGLNGRVYLTAPQRSHCGLGDAMMKASSLRSWWPAATQENFDADNVAPICSLACHSDALWALSGNTTGEVHLYTVRHEPGKLHHTFKDHRGAVSGLVLSTDEKSVFSGSHDGLALQLDLDRGTVARKFNHPGAQITALGLKPLYPFPFPQMEMPIASPAAVDGLIAMPDAEEVKPRMEGVAAAPEENDSEGYDPLFDDDEGNESMKPSPKLMGSNKMASLSLPGRSRTGSAADSTWPILPSVPPLKHGVHVLDTERYAEFSEDLLMTATFGGSLFLWDRRVAGSVGRLENEKSPPWCISACWSATGNEILAGRRNATVDVFDVRQYGESRQSPRLLRTLVNPGDSKTVTCVAAFPDGRHMVCASEDNIRLWNVQEAPVEGWKRKGLPPFKVIPGHHGGLVSQIPPNFGAWYGANKLEPVDATIKERIDELTENPFASTATLEANPFDDPATATSSFHQQEMGSATATRHTDLERRERELAAREEALNQRADHIRKHGRNNFPPFFPLIFHSIKDEIPEAHQQTMTRLFQLWLVLAVTLIVNLVAIIFVVLAGDGEATRDLSSSITYFPLIGILSFLLWYRPVYNAYMKEQAMYFYIYFFFCGWHLLYSIYMVIGIPGTGAAGIIAMIISFQHGHIVAGVLSVIASVGWILQTVGNAFYYQKTWQYHTKAGHTLEKAKGELAANGARSYFSRG